MTTLLASELPREDILGQYPSDAVLYPNDPRLDKDPSGVKIRGDGHNHMHLKNLFDVKDLVPDEETGLPEGAQDDDPLNDYKENELQIIDSLDDAVNAEIEKRGLDHLDDAERWLRAHDPDNPYFKGSKKAA